MDLIAVRQYVQKRGLVPLQDVALHFQVDAEVVQPMLGIWVRKGKMRRHAGNKGCRKGCCACDPQLIETYEWLG